MIKRALTLGIVFALFSLQGTSAQERFSLDQIMSAPFPGGLVAAPAGGHVAWVQNATGERNIWVASPPAYRGRQLTSYDGDNGQEITNLQFTPDGSGVVYIRGGAPNRQGEIPNPTSETDWPDRAIWVKSLDGGEPRKLAKGASPTVAPGGDLVAFVREGQVWAVPLSGDEDASQWFRIRGGAGSLTWSPDGSLLAFRSGRGDHAFIGLYDRADQSVRYLAPSVDNDRYPVWSPDGRSVAFIRTPNRRSALPFEPVREAHPFSIVVADVSTGEGQTVWTAADGRGSAFNNVVASNQLFWGDGGWLAFPWERNGWTNLYAVRARGHTESDDATPLTPGEFEVDNVVLSPDRRFIVYSANAPDIDRRDLFRVSVGGGGGRPEALTSGDDIEWAPAPTSTGRVAFLASGARTPAHARIMASNASASSSPMASQTMPSDFPTDHLVEPEAVIFSGADGLAIHGQLFLPPNATDEPKPAVIFFHGGSRRQMLLGFHYLGYYHNAYSFNQYLASRGFVVLSVNYRSGTGYGLDFREAIDYGARGASEFNDVMGAGLYLRSRADVDPDRIGLWGGSYGGYLTALGLARASDLFAAGVDVHGVHDWNVVVRNFVPSYNAEARAEWSQLAFQSSPLAHVDGWRSPVLLIHGDDDRNAPFSETVDLVEALRERDVEFEQLVFPDEVHGFLLHRNWLRAYRAAAEFLEKKLMDGKRDTTDEGQAADDAKALERGSPHPIPSAVRPLRPVAALQGCGRARALAHRAT